MTLFRLLLNSGGLSQREAARFLDVRIDTVKSWSSGRRQCPEGAIDEMLDLIDNQDRSAKEALSQAREMAADKGGLPDGIDLYLCKSDAEAQERGWPTISAQAASFRRLIEIAPDEIRERINIT